MENQQTRSSMISAYAYPGTFQKMPLAIRQQETAKEGEQYQVTPDGIIGLIARYYHTVPEKIGRRSRRREVVKVRCMCWHFIRRYVPELSLKSCGELLGGYDHTTVISGLRAIQNRIDTEERIVFEAHHIEAMIEASIRLREGD